MILAMKGFTLLETVLASGIALVMGTILIGILVNSSGIFYSQNAEITEGLSLNDAASKIDGFIKQASSVSSGYPEDTPIYSTGDNVLVLKLPALSESGTLSDLYDYVVVVKDPDRAQILRLKIFPHASSTRTAGELVLTILLDDIEFTYLNRDGQPVSPTIATSVGVTVSVLSGNGTTGSGRSSSIITTLRNAGS